ncbi:MAG: helix-turn-helix domain-containing protein [Bacteroidetes bacterium]|nr:helix-turn-helix domain-containing protein [Bacteroidota bacterium]
MEIKSLSRPYELEYMEVSEYQARVHRKTYFEMVFVLEGSGIQTINDHRLPYASDKLFLVFPKDRHGFEVGEKTKFFFIRFNDSYIRTQEKEWVERVEFIFHNHDHTPGCILETRTDKPLVRALVEALIREQAAPNQEMVKQLINTIVTVAVRNIARGSGRAGGIAVETDIATLMLNYIHERIHKPEELKAGVMAAHFNVSNSYISEYFKNRTGQNMQDYIGAYRLKLIEARLRYTDTTLSEIVYEFGFSDASHLNRFFKKWKGMNPSEYRKGL